MSKNIKKNSVIISAATISAAAHSIVEMDSAGEIIEVFSRDKYADIADIALASIQSEALVRSIAPAVSRTILLDNEMMSERYVEVAQQAYEIDNTWGTGFSCYNNCHSACHGSRGWR
jgi:hypothetical protein